MSEVNKFVIKNLAILSSTLVNIFILILFIMILPDSMHKNQNMDYVNEYNPIALNIVNGEKYNHVEPSICLSTCEDVRYAQNRRPPIFPLLIALSYKLEDITAVKQYNILIFLQYILHIFSSILIFLTFHNWTRHKINAFFASTIYGSYPLGLYLLKQPNSEVIFNFLLSVFILVFSLIIKNKLHIGGYKLLIAGALLGLLILSRSLSFLLPLFILFYIIIFFKGTIIKASSKLIMGLLIILLPWQIYSNSLSKSNVNVPEEQISNSKNFPITVLVYGLYWEQMPERSQSSSAKYMSDDLMQFMQKTYEKSSNGLLKSKSEVLGYVLNEAIKSPLTILELGAWKTFRAFYGTDSKSYEREVLIINLLYLIPLLIIFFKRKKIFFGSEDRRFTIFLLLIFFYFIAVSAAFIPLVRYSLSGMLVIVPLTSILISKLIFLDNNNKVKF